MSLLGPARRVHLVRHGLPLVDPDLPASGWELDPAAEHAVRHLRGSGRLPQDAHWFTSPEPKARRTAALLTDRPVEVVDGLREQVRLHVGWIADFGAVLAAAYDDPDRPAYEGWEPLETTRRRATTAVRDLMRRYPTGDLVLVGHGTCLSLVAADLTGTPVDPRAPTAWGFPDVVTVEMPRPSRFAPLSLRSGLLVALVVAIAELVAWEITGRVGWVLVPSGVGAALAAGPRRTRELGVSLLAAVLLSSFAVTVVLLGLIRMPT
jgi:broad specificity phosphatase PhoE